VEQKTSIKEGRKESRGRNERGVSKTSSKGGSPTQKIVQLTSGGAQVKQGGNRPPSGLKIGVVLWERKFELKWRGPTRGRGGSTEVSKGGALVLGDGNASHFWK